jgi:hypothetical protein
MLALFGPQGGDVNESWDQRAIGFLSDAGYVLVKGEWKPKPGISKWEDMTSDEQTCMAYLFEEWDFGGLIEETPHAE